MSASLHVTLLGHKDHGKSTLIGRLLHDTKSVKEDRLHEVEATSRALGKPFEYAFLLDSFREEREDGMTIDVIHAQIKGRERLYDCIDVPGHRELIKNMLTGASHADHGILIVSAAEGIEEQTGHHLRLARWLGLERLLVAVNKMDRVGWAEKSYREIRDGVLALYGPGGDERLTFIPVSAMEGDNVVARSQKSPWFTGRSLFEEMEALARPKPAPDLPLRFPVQSVLPGADGRPLVVGRVEAGSVRTGDRLLFLPSGVSATVAAIHGAEKALESAAAGENVGLALDPPPAGIGRGAVACPTGTDPRAIVRNEVPVLAIFLEPPPSGERLVGACGTTDVECEIDARGAVEVAEVAPVTLRFRDPIVAERGRTTIGRVAVKLRGRIVAVGVVEG